MKMIMMMMMMMMMMLMLLLAMVVVVGVVVAVVVYRPNVGQSWPNIIRERRTKLANKMQFGAGSVEKLKFG